MDRFGEVSAVHIRDEAEFEVTLAIEPQRLVCHDRAEIGAADADVDHRADRPSRVAFPRAGAEAVRKVRHPVEDRVHLRSDILAINQDRRTLAASEAPREAPIASPTD